MPGINLPVLIIGDKMNCAINIISKYLELLSD